MLASAVVANGHSKDRRLSQTLQSLRQSTSVRLVEQDVKSAGAHGEAWHEVARRRRAERDEGIPEALRLGRSHGVASTQRDVSNVDVSRYLSPLEIDITAEGDLAVLVSHLASGRWMAEAVAVAYGKRMMIAQQLVNCCTQMFVDRAVERARELDRALAETGKPVGPLHGVPVSLKEQIDVEGVEMTLGYVGKVGNMSSKNAVVVDLLVGAGAVVFVHTNVPQGLVFSETVNNLWGQTSNPFNRTLTAGGSSGGEGALLALKGSPLGVGSDLGGSIRGPASYNGLYGLRPSSHRVPYALASNTMDGQEAVMSVLGPLSRSVSGLRIFMQAILAGKPWDLDPTALRLPWRQDAYDLADHGGLDGHLCFGMISDDGFCKPMPPYLRALALVKEALLAAGHSVVDFALEETEEGVQLLREAYNADGGRDILLDCAAGGEPRIGWPLDTPPTHLSTYEYWQLCRRRREFTKRQLDRWQASSSITGTGRPFDALLLPPAVNAPGPHGAGLPDSPSRYIYYAGLSNLCDYSATVLPVTHVDPLLDIKPPPHAFRSDVDRAVYQAFDPDMHRDGKIGVQLVGRKHEEEAIIRITEIVDAAVRKHMPAR